MNWLLIAVIGFIAFHIVSGYSKGFLRTIYYLVQWVLVLAFVTWATPYVTNVLMQNEAIESSVEKGCNEWLTNTIKDQTNSDTSVDDTNTQRQAAEEWLAGLGIKFPEPVSKQLLNTNQLADQVLDQTGAYTLIAHNMAVLVIKGIAYILVLIASGIIFRFIGKTLKIVDYIPILNGVNKFLGLGAGVLKGVIGVWIFMTVVAFLSTTEFGNYMTGYIYEAPVLTWLYENNFILNTIMNFV